MAPDLFHGRGKVASITAVVREARARRGGSFADVDAARTWLAARADCTSTIGVIGYSMGGGLALLLATDRPFAVASINYPAIAPKTADTVPRLEGACPIVASYGAKDWARRGAADRLERALGSLGVEHDVKEYPDAGHGFLNDHDGAGDKNRLVFTVLGKPAMGRPGYHEAAAHDARRRIIRFFDVRLKG